MLATAASAQATLFAAFAAAMSAQAAAFSAIGASLGGAVAGCSVESMSFRHGGFHDTCLEYEVVTTAGERLTCSRESEPEAFEAIHGSYGTLGILTRIKFRLIPAQPYVKLEYHRFPTFEAFDHAMREHSQAPEGQGYDFMDGIIHSPTHLTLCLGRFVAHTPHVSSYRGTEIFYKSTARLSEDYLTTFDYCFRYDTECHWLSRTVPPLEWKPVRALLGRWFLGSTNLIRWTKRLDRVLGLKKRPDVVIDVFIPQLRLREFFDWYAAKFDFWPLWIVPYRAPRIYGWVADAHQERMRPAPAP
jgi:FAD/FMN-containing dehydrogenase